MLTLIEGGEVFGPEPLGRASVLLMNGALAKIGPIERRAVEALGVELATVDCAGGMVVPGFLDPHEHLLGGSGESGFSSQTPELSVSEIASVGITTVVGCLGVDTTMKTMPGLLAKAKALREEGLSAYLWSGGYNVPPTTITSSIRDDMLFISEVIGAGEIAISDERSTDPAPLELARLVNDARVGGLLSRKSGRTHFHVGPRDGRLHLLRQLIDEHDVEPEWLYPTHITRSEELMREAIDLARRGAFVDIDTVNEDLQHWLHFYLNNGGPPAQLTASSDASITKPGNLSEQIRYCMREGFEAAQVLPLVTTNAARALGLPRKGRIAVGCDADVLVLAPGSLDVLHVFAGGCPMLRDGQLVRRERFLMESNRNIRLEGRQ